MKVCNLVQGLLLLAPSGMLDSNTIVQTDCCGVCFSETC